MQTVVTLQDIEARRNEFPALSRHVQGRPLAFFDGPAGTQVPQSVIDAISGYYSHSNSNTCGQFLTSRETDYMLREARRTTATFLNAPDPGTISFGANMTTLCYALVRAIRPHLEAGDEVLITQLDHEANRGPWLTLRDMGVRVREVALLKSGRLDEEDMRSKVNEKTRLMAIGHASNFMGTINNLGLARRLTREVGAWLLVDAVHSAPHRLLDMEELDPDFLLCSAYKFYGPHIGILYSRLGLLDRLTPERLRTQTQVAPHRIETGTLNHAAIAGVTAAVEFLGSYGEGHNLRDQLRTAYAKVVDFERHLARQLWEGLQQLEMTTFGPDFNSGERAPTIAFRHPSVAPIEVARQLGDQGIHVWDGDFYAVRAAEILGIEHLGGVVRVGITLSNCQADVERLLSALRGIS